MILDSILKRIPQFASASSLTITELTGGITNKNYKITDNGESYVLRMGGTKQNILASIAGLNMSAVCLRHKLALLLNQ